MIKEKLVSKIGKVLVAILSDIGGLVEGLYPLLMITCLIGLFLSMAGIEKKGKEISSISFLLYLIARVMASVQK